VSRLARTGRRCQALATLAAAVMLTLLAVTAGASAAAAPAKPKVRTSLTAVEGNYMCVLCHEPLAVADSPQATTERQFIERLVVYGDTPSRIKTQMVATFGVGVLALPPAHGFNLVVYVLPPVLVLLGIAFLIYTLPKWRARARAAKIEPYAGGGDLSDEDSDRLAKDLARFD
jgi:cytochrome c-type biogenesis protein CcmH